MKNKSLTLVQALIIIEWFTAMYCYVGPPPPPLTNPLQRVENCDGRPVIGTRKMEHTKPVLFQLHWLPLRLRSLYKILFHTFKVLSGTTPLYLSDLIQKYITMRVLRSQS